MRDQERKLAPFVRVDMDERRRDRQWDAIAASFVRPPPARWRWPAAATVATLTLLAGGVTWDRLRTRDSSPTIPKSVTSIEGTRIGEQALTLPDGSKARLGPGALVRIPGPRPDDVRVLLDRGRIQLVVVPAPPGGRRFVVEAGPVQVVVVGTEFFVDRDREGNQERITVTVQHGTVSMSREGHPEAWPVGTGQSVTVTAPLSDDAAGAKAPPAIVPKTAAAPTANPSGDVPPEPVSQGTTRSISSRNGRASGVPDREKPSKMVAFETAPPARKELPRESIPTQALPAPPRASPVQAAAPPAPRPPVSLAQNVAPTQTAGGLLRQAEQARAEGRLRDAERTLDLIRTQFRGDSRAALAAFELGRLLLDRLASPARAVQALEDAVQLAPAAPFREHVEARLVEALAASGDTAGCLRARAAFLSKFADSAHGPAVRALCTPTE